MCNLAVECLSQVDFFAKVLAAALLVTCNLAVEWRKPSEVFCGGPSGRHCGLFVTLRLSAVRPMKVFAKLFSKSGFWLLLQK